MHRRTRITLISIAAFIVVIILAAVIAVYLMLQPERFTNLLRAQANKAGLTLALSAPAEPTLWPQPGLVLHGLTLSVDNRPVLVAARARLVLPWHTLFGGPITITRLELDSPRINLAQLGPVLAHMNHGASSGAPSLPHIDTGIRITHGSLARGRNLLLDDIHLETGPLSPGHVFSMQLSADTAHGNPVKMSLLMTPHVHKHAISFDNIHITASGPSDLALTLDGRALWHGGTHIDMSLNGTLTRSHQRHYIVKLGLDPPGTDTPFMFHLKLTGPGLHANVHLSPSRLIAWWQKVSDNNQLSGLPLPPFTGIIDAKEITLGNTHIEGLHVVAGQPATTSSTPAPATSAPAKP